MVAHALAPKFKGAPSSFLGKAGTAAAKAQTPLRGIALIIASTDARERMLRGVDILANAVRVTFRDAFDQAAFFFFDAARRPKANPCRTQRLGVSPWLALWCTECQRGPVPTSAPRSIEQGGLNELSTPT